VTEAEAGAGHVPWPPDAWRAMQSQASIWRAKRQARPDAGTLFLLDGASCSGKSTLVDRLTADPTLPIDLIPRCSTRERRPDDQPRREYLFVSREAFVDLARAGGFIEYRDFQFGMSYGLPWAEAFSPLLEGRHGLAVINLGNVRYVKALVPEAVTILVDAPLATIRQRLIARGLNTPEQIEERLTNAARVEAYRPYYDYVVRNDDGTLNVAEDFLRSLVLARTPRENSSRT
jgi:guanylate kinase